MRTGCPLIAGIAAFTQRNMMVPGGSAPDREIARLSYERQARVELDEAQARLIIVKARIRTAVANGDLVLSEALNKAEVRADVHLRRAGLNLKGLIGAGDESWDEFKNVLEVAQEDIADSVRKIVSRLPR